MRHNAWRIVVAFVVGALAATIGVFAPSAGAAPAGYPATICATLQVSATNVRVGESITVTGLNFLPNAKVGLALKPIASNTTAPKKTYNLKTVTASASGSFTTTVVMPAATTNQGNFLIFATSGGPGGTSCPADPAVTLTLRATAGVDSLAASNPAANNLAANNPGSGSTTTNSAGTTAFTGVNVALMLIAAAALIVVGFVVNARGRRRHASIR